MPLTINRTTDATAEPILFAEAQAHLRVDTADEQTLIESLITAARMAVEEYTDRQLITATWTLKLDAFPSSMYAIELPKPPLLGITSIAYLDGSGVSQTLSASTDYQSDLLSSPGRLVPQPGMIWPITEYQRLNAVTIVYTAGYGAAGSSVPRPIRQAMLLLIGQWYEHRENIVVGTIATELPMAVKALLGPYRVMTQR